MLLTEVGLVSELPTKPLHGLSQDGLGLRVARSFLLSPHTRHGVNHAHLGSGCCEGKALMKASTTGSKVRSRLKTMPDAPD